MTEQKEIKTSPVRLNVETVDRFKRFMTQYPARYVPPLERAGFKMTMDRAVNIAGQSFGWLETTLEFVDKLNGEAIDRKLEEYQTLGTGISYQDWALELMDEGLLPNVEIHMLRRLVVRHVVKKYGEDIKFWLEHQGFKAPYGFNDMLRIINEAGRVPPGMTSDTNDLMTIREMLFNGGEW